MDLVTHLLGNVSAMLALLEMIAASVSPLHTINTHHDMFVMRFQRIDAVLCRGIC